MDYLTLAIASFHIPLNMTLCSTLSVRWKESSRTLRARLLSLNQATILSKREAIIMGHAWSKALSLACPTDDVDGSNPGMPK